MGDTTRLRGKNAIILGCSAEGGSGWAIAEAFAAAGAEVVVAARSAAPLEGLAKKIGGHSVLCDASDPSQVANLVRKAEELLGPIDIALNAAADPVTGTIAALAADRVQHALDANYLSNVAFIREIAPRMRDGGSIIIMSTMGSVQPVGEFFSYACAKAATDCLVRYAAVEFGPRGIRVNSILPGPIKTVAARSLMERGGVENRMAREIPLGRVGLPEDYADAALWLAGPAFVTGLNIPVCGGNQLTRLLRADEFLPTP